MYGTISHQQIVNEYHDECVRKALEKAARRDESPTTPHRGAALRAGEQAMHPADAPAGAR